MEAEEQNIIEIDKSWFCDKYRGDRGYNTLSDLNCAQSLGEQGVAKLFEHEGKSYIVPGTVHQHGKVISADLFEVVPLVPDMPSITYNEAHTVMSWLDGWVDDISDELSQRVIDIENYFSMEISRGGYVGYRVKSGKNMYVCNGVRVTPVPRKHGNSTQEAFSFAEPAQLQL